MREYRFSVTHIFPYKDRIVDSVFIWENAGQLKPVFSHILCSAICATARELNRQFTYRTKFK